MAPLEVSRAGCHTNTGRHKMSKSICTPQSKPWLVHKNTLCSSLSSFFILCYSCSFAHLSKWPNPDLDLAVLSIWSSCIKSVVKSTILVEQDCWCPAQHNCCIKQHIFNPLTNLWVGAKLFPQASLLWLKKHFIRTWFGNRWGTQRCLSVGEAACSVSLFGRKLMALTCAQFCVISSAITPNFCLS